MPDFSFHSEHQNPAPLSSLTVTALMTSVLCVLAPFSLPIGPVPLSLTHFAVYLSLYLLGQKNGTLSYVLYLLLGIIGLPVFSGFSGGIGKLLGPTGGYLIGTIPLAWFCGGCIEKTNRRLFHFLSMLFSMILCYIFGTLWFCFSMKTSISAALTLCVIPFLPGDLFKIFLALWCGPSLKKRIQQSLR